MIVNSICIAGGGSSGWMLAVALQKYAPKLVNLQYLVFQDSLRDT